MGCGGEATGQPHTIAASGLREGRTDVGGREGGTNGRDGRQESTGREGGREEEREEDSGEASTFEYCVGSLETGAASEYSLLEVAGVKMKPLGVARAWRSQRVLTVRGRWSQNETARGRSRLAQPARTHWLRSQLASSQR